MTWPNETLSIFLSGLKRPMRAVLHQAIALAREMPEQPSGGTERAVQEMLRPPQRWLALQRTIVVAGVIDHCMAVIPPETLVEALYNEPGDRRAVASIERRHWQIARVKWLGLRVAGLSPAAIEEFQRSGDPDV